MGQPRWKSSGVEKKAYTENIENSIKLMELRQILKELSDKIQKIILTAKKRLGVLEDSSNTGDDQKLWKVIKSLN